MPASETPELHPSLRIRISIAIAAVVLPILAIEVGGRVLDKEYGPLEVPIFLAARGASLDLASQDGLYLPDPHELWTPRPGAALGMVSPDPEERINADGFRGPALELDRADGVLRIATLGDSSTFGALVRGDETYTALLPEYLPACEVLNFGVVGFTARQGLERYRRRVRDYQPDYVVAAFGAVNDSTDAHGRADDVVIAERVAADSGTKRWRRWLRRNSRVVHLLSWIGDDFGDAREGEIERVKNEMIAENTPDPGVVAADWDGTRRVSPAELEELLLTLAAEVQADGAQLVLISMPRKRELEAMMPVLLEYTAAIEGAGAAGDLPLVDARNLFFTARPPEQEGELFANEHDTVHPSPVGHALIAEALAETIAAHAGR